MHVVELLEDIVILQEAELYRHLDMGEVERLVHANLGTSSLRKGGQLSFFRTGLRMI